MKHSDDIVNLFQQFDAKADPYHELARQQDRKVSGERWPLVSAVRDAVTGDVPSVNRAASAAAPRASAPVMAPPQPPAQVQPHSGPVAATPTVPVSSPVAALASRSPLAGLAGLHTQPPTAQSDGAAKHPDVLPIDLPSVFARLAGAAAPQAPATYLGSTPAWQPRKGHS